MKIKKGLAAILALAMIITLMPTMAFAATQNSVAKTYTVAADEVMPVVAIDLKVNDALGMSGANKFKLTLENAEWAVDNPTTDNIFDENSALKNAYAGGQTIDNAGLALSTIGATETAVAAANVEVNAVETDSATITYTPADPGVAKDSYVRIYLALRAGSENGEVKVTIDQMDSAVTSGTYTVATASGNTTIAEVTGKVKTYPRQEITGATVEITETSVNAINTDQILKLTLPKGYSWKGLEVSGDLATGFDSYSEKQVTSPDNLTSNGECYKVDERTIYVYVEVAPAANMRESIVLTPTFDVTRDAAMGDITLTVSSYKAVNGGNKVATANGLVIATYGDESVQVTTVDEEDLPEIVAGYLDDKDGNPFVVKVTLKETTKGSLSAGRYIDFDFNDEIQVINNGDIKIKYYVGTGSRDYDEAKEVPAALLDFANNKTKDCSEFTITVPPTNSNGTENTLDSWNTTKANTLTLYIPVTAEANFTGDVELAVSGAKAGIEDTSLVVGKVIAPITVETQISDIVNGAQQQAAADITITENIAGYLDAGENIVLDLDTLGLDGFAFGDATAAVTAGDLDINKIIVNKSGTITIPVKDTSTTESTIEISDVIVNLGRNLPVGNYNLSVGGIYDSTEKGAKGALVENWDYMDKEFSDVTVEVPYLNITTASDGINATFTEGAASYTMNGQSVTMDAAPYIDSNSRMMVPIRYAANAMGVTDANIQWNGYTQTGTISGAKGVVQVKVGSTSLVTSNGTITMDTVAVNKDGRIYVPVRYIANALGANVAWDATTRTATFY